MRTEDVNASIADSFEATAAGWPAADRLGATLPFPGVSSRYSIHDLFRPVGFLGLGFAWFEVDVLGAVWVLGRRRHECARLGRFFGCGLGLLGRLGFGRHGCRGIRFAQEVRCDSADSDHRRDKRDRQNPLRSRRFLLTTLRSRASQKSDRRSVLRLRAASRQKRWQRHRELAAFPAATASPPRYGLARRKGPRRQRARGRVRCAPGPARRLEPQSLPPIKAVRTLPPKGISQPSPGVFVYDFGQTSNRWGSAEASQSAATHIEHAIQVQIVTNVRKAYFQARAQRDLIDVAVGAVANQEMHLKQIEEEVGAGMRAEIDRVTAGTSLANARVQLISAQNAYDLACAAFNRAR